MRKQASENSEVVSGESGRPGASPGRGQAVPSQGLGLAERV